MVSASASPIRLISRLRSTERIWFRSAADISVKTLSFGCITTSVGYGGWSNFKVIAATIVIGLYLDLMLICWNCTHGSCVCQTIEYSQYSRDSVVALPCHDPEHVLAVRPVAYSYALFNRHKCFPPHALLLPRLTPTWPFVTPAKLRSPRQELPRFH
jgi:hypothetical protein